MISCSEARELIGKFPVSSPTERVPLAQARGRVLAEPLSADRDGPPFHRVAMDGIAISALSFQNGQRQWICEGLQAAGSPQLSLSSPDACLEAMTGAVLPLGCDAVIPFEHCQLRENVYYCEEHLDLKVWTNIHHEGSDFKKNDCILSVHQRLRGAECAVAASLGYSFVSVKKCPSIALITTGSELVDIEQVPLNYQIRKSNIHAARCALEQRGFSDIAMFHLSDHLDKTQTALKECLEQYDVLILSGGVSKGKLDFVPQALENLGVQKIFHHVAQKPGKPMWFGHREQHLVFALPGNPASMLICLENYVLPHLDTSLGHQRSTLLLPSLNEIKARPKMTLFKTVRLVIDAKGLSAVQLVEDNGSGDYASLCGGDGFIEIPPAESTWPSGKPFHFRPWS